MISQREFHRAGPRKKCPGMAALIAMVMATLVATPRAQAEPIEPWLGFQFQRSLDGLMHNIAPQGAAPGAVVASPSNGTQAGQPNYFYHWVRDAGLVMDTIAMLYARPDRPERKQVYFNQLLAYAAFSEHIQVTPNRSGSEFGQALGEPKWMANGSADNENWARPQNDGPALRALSLIHFSQTLLAEGKQDLVRQLYAGRQGAGSGIKADLEFVSHFWQRPCADLWEERGGIHFYTRMVQRRAMVEGANLAQQLGDAGAANFYRQQVAALSTELQKHWDARRQLIVPTFDKGCDRSNPVGQSKCNDSDIDVAVILGSLHGCAGDGFFCPGSDPVLASAMALRDAFLQVFPINATTKTPAGDPLGVAVGRYPEDLYDGVGTAAGGNPWFLATNALGELYLRAGLQWQHDGANFRMSPIKARFLQIVGVTTAGNGPIPLNAAMAAVHQAADAQFRRVKFHVPQDGGLTEQYNRNHGFEQGAHDLTWSYASFLTAVRYR